MNTHEHKECEHKEIAYCNVCKIVYCKACSKEWRDNFYYPVSVPSIWTDPYTTATPKWDTIIISNVDMHNHVP